MEESRKSVKTSEQNKIDSFLFNLNKLNSKINLFTLTIRDQEIQREYQDAKEQYYWPTICALEIMQAILLALLIPLNE